MLGAESGLSSLGQTTLRNQWPRDTFCPLRLHAPMLWFLLNMADFLTDIHLDLETSHGDQAGLPWVVRPVETRVSLRSQSGDFFLMNMSQECLGRLAAQDKACIAVS